MIITDRFVFVHVPKTGGQSITTALGGRTEGINLHRPLFSIEKGDRKAFGFVRNPWDRLISLYSFMCQKVVRPEDAAYQRSMRDMGFKNWLMNDRYFVDEDKLWPGVEPIQRRPQTWYLDGCDRIGRFERMDADMASICEEFEIEPVSVPHMNRSRHAAYTAYYDAESAAFVATHFAPDIERFGYTFN